MTYTPAFAISTPFRSTFTSTQSQVTTSRRIATFAPRSARYARVARPSLWEMKIGIVFGSITGNTEEIAGLIKDNFGDDAEDPIDVGDVTPAMLAEYEAIMIGAPTWNTGEEEQRSSTGWDDFLYDELPSADLSGKPVAVFGVGDGVGYGDNFCDAIEELHDCFAKQGAKMIGYTDTSTVEFAESKSVRDGKFLGIAIDMTNEPEKAEARVEGWCAQLKSEAGL